jgi:hypothetical protein
MIYGLLAIMDFCREKDEEPEKEIISIYELV